MRQTLYRFINLVNKRKGQGLVEYAFIICFVALALVVALSLIHEPITGIFAKVADQLGGTP
ncbi:MAG: Flp family type IVb pilin [Clostridia bacterium]|nr:Flp family type IVb pilin [Clostridia bacterium]